MQAVLENPVTAKSLHASAVDRLRIILNRQQARKIGFDNLVKESPNITPFISGIVKSYDRHPYACLSFHYFQLSSIRQDNLYHNRGKFRRWTIYSTGFHIHVSPSSVTDCPFRQKNASAARETIAVGTLSTRLAELRLVGASGSETSVTEV